MRTLSLVAIAAGAGDRLHRSRAGRSRDRNGRVDCRRRCGWRSSRWPGWRRRWRGGGSHRRLVAAPRTVHRLQWSHCRRGTIAPVRRDLPPPAIPRLQLRHHQQSPRDRRPRFAHAQRVRRALSRSSARGLGLRGGKTARKSASSRSTCNSPSRAGPEASTSIAASRAIFRVRPGGRCANSGRASDRRRPPQMIRGPFSRRSPRAQRLTAGTLCALSTTASARSSCR